jgi:hypothetical protein
MRAGVSLVEDETDCAHLSVLALIAHDVVGHTVKGAPEY